MLYFSFVICFAVSTLFFPYSEVTIVLDALNSSISNTKNHSYEGLTLEMLVFESFTVANLPYRPCG